MNIKIALIYLCLTLVMACNSPSSSPSDSPQPSEDPGKEENSENDAPEVEPTAELDTPAACEGEIAQSEPGAGVGQLVVEVGEELDPCSLSGYVVGKENILGLKKSGDLFVIENIPPGSHDVVVTGQLAVQGLKATQQGTRLNGVEILAGNVTNLGKIELPAVGQLTGKVQLSGQTDHAGIDVYIPGTGFSAKTDKEGNYSIAPYVVAGETNIYFEKDGYHRGQVEKFKIEPGKTNTLEPLSLVLSTGAEGFILLNDGDAVSKSRKVNIIIGATPDARLMKISETNTFDGIPWKPLVTNTTYEFETEGSKTLYIQFADGNGLPSSPFNDTIEVDIFTNDEGSIVINSGDSQTDNRNVSLALSLPENAHEMLVSNSAGFGGATWETPVTTKAFEFTNQGTQWIYVKYRDADGFVSNTFSDSINVDLFGDVTIDFSLSSSTLASPARQFTLTGITQPANGQTLYVDTNSGFSTNVQSYAPATSVNFTVPQKNSFCTPFTIYLRWKDADGYFSPTASESASISCWQTMSTTGAPSERMEHTSVWAGSKFVVFSGGDNSYNTAPIAGGAEYDGTWSNLPTTTMPAAREYHSSVWTGTEVIVWGGSYTSTEHNSGGRYNLTTWTATDTTDPDTPDPRRSHSAVWTGTEMIIWGGNSSYNYSAAGTLDDGGRYNPASNDWDSMNMTNAPSARMDHSAVWTGSEMIIWGGSSNGYSTQHNDGARYNPSTDTWTTMSMVNAPSPRDSHIAIWTGTKMIVFGGWRITTPRYLGDAKAYDPTTDTWSNISTVGKPSNRGRHTAVWTGSKMIVWGGAYGTTTPTVRYNNGAIYDPSDDTWQALPTAGAPVARSNHTAAWSGDSMYIWGGYDGSNFLNSGATFRPIDP